MVRGQPYSLELTQREREVGLHLAVGKSYSEIAASLFIAPETVRTHVESIVRKLDVPNRVCAACVMLADGIIDAEEFKRERVRWGESFYDDVLV